MRKSVVVLFHISYWAIYTLLILLIILAVDGGRSHIDFLLLKRVMLSSPLGVFCFVPSLIGFYTFYLLLFSAYLSKKKITSLIMASLVTSLIGSAVGVSLLCMFWKTNLLFANEWESAIGITLFMGFTTLLHGVIGLVVKGFITAYNDITLKEELNKKNYEMELALVKNQINPHFLFNTINNIDVLIMKDATQASTYLNKLSDIMRFMLYETKTEKIPISKELSYIEKYIDLQKIRTSNINYVNYHVEGDGGNLVIAPMLFIPFIENAFKHAENKKLDNAVNIKLTLSKEMIIFECENKFSERIKNNEQSGLGNELIVKRLKLLYPNRHTLDVNNIDLTYSVKLIVQA